MSTIPDGWTDDLTIPLPAGRTVADFVEFVIQAALSGTPDADQIEQELMTTFGISLADAALVRDRVFGGIVRAATGNAANQPDATKDPFAYESYERATRERSIITAIYPELSHWRGAKPKGWWQRLLGGAA